MADDTTEFRNITYRLLPQKRSNWRWLDRTLEAQRQLYNAALEERIDCYRKTGRSITYIDQAKSLTVCRSALPGMADTAVAIQRGTLKRLDEAFKGFFRRVKTGGAGFPRFQGHRRFNSIGIVSGVQVDGAGSRKTRDRFECVACGHADHADLNAAANILALGTGASARGGCRRNGPVNREINRRAA